MKADLRPFLDRLTNRSRLSETEQEAILGLPAQPQTVDAHRDCVRPGELVDHVSVVIEGVLARFGQNVEGERHISALHIAGDAPDLHLVVVPTDSCPLQALTKTTIVRVPHIALRAVAVRYPAIAEAFWRHCSVDAAITAQWVVNLARRNAQRRIAHLMCEMAIRNNSDVSKGEVSFSFPLKQDYLADATGLTAVHVNRTLKALAADGLLSLSDRTARIPDWGRLVDRGEFESGYLRAGLQPGQRLRMVD